MNNASLILIPLIILLASTIIVGANIRANVSTGNITGNNQTISGSNSNTLLGQNISINVTVMLGVMLAIAIAASIAVLSTGTVAGGARIFVVLVGMTGLWAILSYTGSTPITDIPVVGSLIYDIMSLAYLVGTIQMVSGSGGSE